MGTDRMLNDLSHYLNQPTAPLMTDNKTDSRNRLTDENVH